MDNLYILQADSLLSHSSLATSKVGRVCVHLKALHCVPSAEVTFGVSSAGMLFDRSDSRQLQRPSGALDSDVRRSVAGADPICCRG